MHTLTTSTASIWLRHRFFFNNLYVDYTNLKLIVTLNPAIVQFSIGAHPESPLIVKCEM